MPKAQITATRPPDQQVVVDIAEQIRSGQLTEQVRYHLADLLVLADQHGNRLPLPVQAAVDAVVAACRVSNTDLTAPVPLMTVRILDRWGAVAKVRAVTIPAVCVRCGGPRGEAFEINSLVHGFTYVSDFWANPCGHHDTAQAALIEARRYAEVIETRVEALAGGAR